MNTCPNCGKVAGGQSNILQGCVCQYSMQAPPQPEQEPVAWPCLIAEADFSQDTVTLKMQCNDYKVSSGKHWLYTTPPQRTWVGLTDEEIGTIAYNVNTLDGIRQFSRAIEAKLKERNT